MASDAPDGPEPERTTTVEAPGPTKLKARLLGRLRLGGCAAALVAVWASFGPSLLPRAPLVQGAITALNAAVFYGLGAAVASVVGAVRSRRGLPSLATSRAWRVLGVAGALLVAIGLIRWLGQQRDQAELVGAARPGLAALPIILVVAALLSALLLAIGRLVGHGVVAFDRRLGRRLPLWAAHTIAGVVAVVLIVSLTNRFVVHRVVDGANASFGALDDTTEEGIEPPEVAEQSGGPGSLVDWDTLGFQGRTFAGSATTRAELEATAGDDLPVAEPIRVYVGLQSADSPEERAALAVEELERTGAFDRPVLVIATTTGTGWINPRATESLERLWNGNTAIVGQQYSYLPSWISFLVDTEKAAETGEALIGAVAGRWAELPEDDRPLLVVFGESLGSLGSESALERGSADASIEHVLATADRVLWVGPPDANPIRAQLTAARDAGSPVWRPEVGDGEVGFATGVDELGEPASLEIQYLQHPSDPVVWWDWPTLWSRPEWLAEERGADVPDETRWVPFVTWSQTVADLAAGFSADRGHGHNYDDTWTRAWATLLPAPDVDPDRLAAIEATLADG